MDKVDELIEKFAIHISEKISSGKYVNGEIEGKTEALANLISARALIKNPNMKNV